MPKKELDIIRAINGHDKIRVSKDIYREIFRQGIKYELELIEAYREYVKRSEDAKTAMKEAIKDTVFENAKGIFEKVATTETTTAMNKGTLDAGETESFIAGYQFRAIMDERTTIYCRPRNNMLISKNDPVTLAANTPPLHYNCRSGLIPMTKREIALLGGENRLQLDRIKFATLETFNWATGKPD
jgi:SPP1 gp7 family putative phage head morphogenesis protein